VQAAQIQTLPANAVTLNRMTVRCHRHPQAAKLAAVTFNFELNLGHRFRVVVISEEVRVAKPAPGIYLIACRRAGVRPSDAIYVGDRLEDDALAARAAGLRGIWLNRSGECKSERDDIAEVTSLSQLTDAADPFTTLDQPPTAP
jgi:putative hydrolase of the HAD superfamily